MCENIYSGLCGAQWTVSLPLVLGHILLYFLLGPEDFIFLGDLSILNARSHFLSGGEYVTVPEIPHGVFPGFSHEPQTGRKLPEVKGEI